MKRMFENLNKFERSLLDEYSNSLGKVRTFESLKGRAALPKELQLPTSTRRSIALRPQY